MANNKANFIRVWLDMYKGMALVGYDFTTQQNYFNLYNQKDAYQLDWIFNYAETKGVNVMLCLFTHGAWGDAGYCNNAWTNRNPFNSKNGGPISTPFQFFSNSTAISITKNLLKYIVSRWGFNTNLVSWELWNEVNQIQIFNPNLTPPNTYVSDILSWHTIMYNYIKSIDPHKHLITTSYAGDLTSSNQSVFSVMDFTQSHDYKDPIVNTNDDFQNHFYAVAQRSINTMNKPYMNGEWGFSETDSWTQFDPKGFELHNSLWSSTFSTALGSVSNWWWDSYIKTNNLFGVFKPISVFMNAIPVPSQLFFPYKISNINGLRTYYMKNSNNDTIYGWSQDINFHFQNLRLTIDGNNYLKTLNPNYKPSPSSSINEINIPVIQNNKQYIVKWYSAETGLEFQKNTVISNNNLVKIYIPKSLRASTYGDAVFAIYLDCNKYIWREGTLNNNSYQNVSGNVVCSKINGQVFYKTFDNKIHSMWWDNNSNTWQWSALNNTANNVAGDMAITQDGSIIFYRTTNNKINSIWWDSNIQNWQWSELNQAANGNVRGPIAVSSNGQVFYRTLDNKLNNIWWNSSTGTWCWSNLNNAANGNVCGNITITPNNQVFYRTCDNKLNNIWWNSSTGIWNWSVLNNSANNVAGDLMADNTGKVYYRNTNSDINCIYWRHGSWFWSGLDNSTSNNVYPGNIATDNLGNVFFRGSDNRVHRIYYKSQCYYIPSTNFQKNALLDSGYYVNTHNDKFTGDSELGILIYPNPTNNKISITLNKNIEQLYVYNIYGKLIKRTTHLNANEVEIDVSMYEDGFYFIKAYIANDQFINSKFIVKH